MTSSMGKELGAPFHQAPLNAFRSFGFHGQCLAVLTVSSQGRSSLGGITSPLTTWRRSSLFAMARR